MTFDEYWESRECEIVAEQSLATNRLSILAEHAWNAALEAAIERTGAASCTCKQAMRELKATP